MPFWIVKPCSLVGGYQKFMSHSSIPQRNRRSVSPQTSSKLPLTWHYSVNVCFTGSNMFLDIWTLKKGPPPLPACFQCLWKACFIKIICSSHETQFMALKQITFSLSIRLSVADLKTAAFSIFLDQTTFGPHRAHISSPLLWIWVTTFHIVFLHNLTASSTYSRPEVKGSMFLCNICAQWWKYQLSQLKEHEWVIEYTSTTTGCSLICPRKVS